jgi:predicted dehydrogenase
MNESVNNSSNNTSQQNAPNQKDKNSIAPTRRTLLKALAGMPIVGLFGFELFRKIDHDSRKKNHVFKELGLDKIEFSAYTYDKSKPGDLIRIGFIGFGNRARALSRGLGFIHPEELEDRKKNETLKNWMEQEDLNVAITGICDVFDLHAQKGLETAGNSFGSTPALAVKRYLNYQEMIVDKDIDAVIIATPDHHHARMAIDAVKAGKHVYLEKSVAHTEEELNELYDVVKNSNITFQLGHQITQSTVFKQAKKIIDNDILGKITLIETTTNRNTAEGAFIRHLDAKGNQKPGKEEEIDWKQWLGNTPYVPFSVDRFYNWTKWFAYDTGLIGQLFSHEFDAVNQLLRIGIPKTVFSSGGIYYWEDNREMADSMHCVFEYPEKDLTLLYSASLASSRNRGRVFMGHDASMELGNNIRITIDRNSTKYKSGIEKGLIDTNSPVMSFNPAAGQVDAVTSATQKYFADRGLTDTIINGRQIDLAHLHLREWLNCIREKTMPSANIEVAYEEGITCLMAHRSYIEKRQVSWDEKNKKII